MAAPPTTLVLFARALRLDDHPALAEAAARGPVLPLFLDGPETDLPQPDQVGRPWLGATLDLLDADLRARGPLVRVCSSCWRSARMNRNSRWICSMV